MVMGDIVPADAGPVDAAVDDLSSQLDGRGGPDQRGAPDAAGAADTATTVVECVDDDGACPGACTPLDDADCAALCPQSVQEIRDPWLAWPGYQIYRPPGDDGTVARPVIIALHGGGGTATAMAKQTCPDRDLGHPGCLHNLAPCLGWDVVYTNGAILADSLGLMRAFNATAVEREQAMEPWLCVSGSVCADNVDHVAYHALVLDDIEAQYHIDERRVFVTGLSNGAAMSHRLACELADRIAAAAPVAGGNQFEAVNGCSPPRPVPIMQIHGSADPCWPYDDETAGDGCSELQAFGTRHSIPLAVAAWALHNGCDAELQLDALVDRLPDDGTSVSIFRHANCQADSDVVLLRLDGAGHTWPGGSDGLPVETVGVLSHEINANREIIRFFSAHPMP
jgi:polyhydroxybutyrate depolymerase